MPVLTPRLSSAWISLVTPVTYRIARPLADGLRNRVVVLHDSAQQLMPHDALSVREAIRQAISTTEAGQIQTRWSAAGPIPGDPDWAGGKVFVDERSIHIAADPSTVFSAVCRVGGGHGWYAGDILWRIRGWMDQLVGGPGLRRGRRHAENVEFGEALDFWRVEAYEPDHLLRLAGEMKLPGRAWLEFEVEPAPDGGSTIHQIAIFEPVGLPGLLYWYGIYPLHGRVFRGMLRGIASAAEAGLSTS